MIICSICDELIKSGEEFIGHVEYVSEVIFNEENGENVQVAKQILPMMYMHRTCL